MACRRLQWLAERGRNGLQDSTNEGEMACMFHKRSASFQGVIMHAKYIGKEKGKSHNESTCKEFRETQWP